MKTHQGIKENRLNAAANACVISCQKLAAEIEQVKQDFLVELRETLEVPERIFRLVLNEAAALAWQTDYPYLVFPALAAEKIQAATEWNARQKDLRRINSVRAMSH